MYVGTIDMSAIVQSLVFTYKRADHSLSIFFNGVFIDKNSAPASSADDVIDWSTCDNIYVNKNDSFTPDNPTHYHKISAYNKILTSEEIEEIYNKSQPGYIPPPPPPPPPPTPPINLTIPDMHWDYETFYDNQNAVLFDNFSVVNILDGKAVIDAPTDFLLAFVPSP